MTNRDNPKVRAIVAIVVALVLAMTSLSAHAATHKKKRKKHAPKPKPVCHLVTDPKGDAPPTGDSSLDIVSADVATNARTITAVIRVAKLSNPDTMAPEGEYYAFNFTAGAGQGGHSLYAMLSPVGNSFEGGAGTGVVDTAKSEIRISVPLSYWTGPDAVFPGPPFHGFIVYADINNNVQPIPTTLTVLGDTATSKATYKPGTPSCVAVGK